MIERSLTLATAVLALAASGLGLFVPDLYRDPEWLVSQTRGQDLVTVVAALVLAAMVPRIGRGSARATLVWIGVLGYMLYTYTGAAFAYGFNELFLLYVAIFSMSIFALVVAAKRIDIVGLAAQFDDSAPRRTVVAYLVLVAFMLSALWLGQIVPFLVTGRLPESIARSGGSLKFVFVLDLGLVVPLAVLAAGALWRRRPWGYVLAGIILIKATTMGLALLSMTWFALRAGQAAELGLFLPWIALTAASLGISASFLRHCRPA